MIQERKISADLIRAFAAIAVIVIHITSLIYYNLDKIGYHWWLAGNILGWGLKWAAPVFVMISGYFLLNSKNSSNPKTFFRHRFGKLLLPFLFWSLVYFLLSFEGRYVLSTPIFFLDKLWHSGTYYHLYFINVMLGLYLATPFLRKYVIAKQLRFIVLLLLTGSMLYLVAYTYLGLPQVNNIFFWFLPYLGYYLAGYWLGSLPPTKYPGLILIFGMIVLSVGILITRKFFFIFDNQETEMVLVKHFSPTVIIPSLCLFYAAIGISNEKIKRFNGLAKLSQLSLGTYFIHPLWIYFFSGLEIMKKIYLSNFGLWLIGMITLCVSASFIGVFVLKKIPLVNKLI